MICNSCGKSFPDSFKSCPYCGNTNRTEDLQLNYIRQNLNYLKNLKNYFEQSISNIENSLTQIEKRVAKEPKIEKAVKQVQPVLESPKKSKEPFIEKFLGEKFLLTIGIIAILFASAFFLKYSFERNLFTPIFRVTVTAISGMAFVLVGYYLKAKYRIFGVILITGGIAVLFFSNFASLVLYKFYGTIIAFLINFILVICSLFLAVRFNSQWVSIVGIGGAYLTPLSLKSTLTNDMGFFTYLMALSLAPLFLAYKKKWITIALLSNLFTTMWFYMWYYSYFKSNSSLNFIYFGIWFYAIFLLITVFYLKEENKNTLFVLSAMVAMFFYPLISIKAMSFAGTQLISPSLCYISLGIILAGVSFLNLFKDREKVFLFAIGILTVFTGIYFNFKHIDFTSLLSITLILSIYLFLILEKKWILVVNLILIIFIFFKSTTYDIFENLGFKFNHFSFRNYSNIASRVMEYLAVVTAISINAKASLKKNSKWFAKTAGFFAGLAILIFLTYEASTAFYKIFHKGQSMAVSVLWAIFAFALFFIGLKKERKTYRYSALILFGVVLLKLFFIDLLSLSALYRVLTFFITGIVLIFSSYIYYKFKGKRESR